MKITAILMLAACLQVGATGYTQTVSLSVKDAQLETVFREIRKQTGYNFIFTREVISAANPVNINVQNATLKDVLELCFQNQPLSFSIEDKFVVIKRKILKTSIKVPDDPSIDIQGKVFNNNGEPIGGATVRVDDTKQATATNEQGEFFLSSVDENATLVISSIGHKIKEVKVQGRSSIEIQLEVSVSSLDETVVIAYGTTTRRLNTGSVGRITAKEIETQPVSNPLAALQGRVPGLFITQSSGVPGSSFSVQIRGRSSLDLNISQNDPLFIIDGVPFEPGNAPTNQIVSAANNPTSISQGGLSPLNSINPMDIASIEVLKDADATAIYGSRGANGVILITTKKGTTGKTRITMNAYKGWSKITRMPDMMNTKEYLGMRKEAFENDSIAMTNTNAPDLLLWDTTRYTDFKKLLIGGTAHTNDIQLTVSGGNNSTSFLLSNSFHKETTVFPGNLSDQRGSFNLNVKHQSENKRFTITVNGMFSSDVNRLISFDPSQYLRLPPHIKLYDSLGKLNWEEGGIFFSTFNSFSNPLAELERKYKSTNELFYGNVIASYEVIPEMYFKINTGYNLFNTDEESIWPKVAIAPNSSLLPSSRFAYSQTKSWIVEPQWQYDFKILNGKSSLLIAGTLQEKNIKGTSISAEKYTNDLLLNSVAAAGDLSIENYSSQYRYTAFFGRWKFNWQNKYLLNFSGRRDGSSRFGPRNKFENFWATGFAWIFTNESFMNQFSKLLSFGKIRGSYGITGNDQIGDYKYLDLWNNTFNTYQNSSGLFPVGLYNPNYSWEKNKKFETSIELGFLQDKILFSATYYRHRSSNQLVNYNLPIQTGFSSVIRNLPALVQNSGLEFSAIKNSQIGKNLLWVSTINITIPKNKLISFPGLSESSYRSSYVEGYPLTIIKRVRYLGVDPETGVYSFEDLNHDGLYNGQDQQVLGSTDPKFYGGLDNRISYKNFNFSFLFQFTRQKGNNYLNYFNNYPPGTAYNQPVFAFERWQQPGDITDLQRYTALPSGELATISRTRLRISDGTYSDASFVRLKNVSLSYTITKENIKHLPFESGNIFLNAQNLLTFTNFKGSDPESQNIIQLPPLKTIAGGIQIIF